MHGKDIKISKFQETNNPFIYVGETPIARLL